MAYDPYAPVNPWWQQQQAPQQGMPFGPPPAPVQQKQWWQMAGMPKSANTSPDTTPSAPGQSANQKPPSLFDMMTNLGRMTPADYNKRIQGGAPSGSYGAIPGMGAGGMNFSPAAMAQVSPWAWLSSMWGGGLGGSGGTPGAG